MSVIFVKDPQTGIDYSVNISGTEPTENEQQQINDFLLSKRQQAPVAAAAPTPEPTDEDSTAIGRGFRRGIEQIGSLAGTALEYAGAGTGLESVERFGRELEEKSQADLQALIEEEIRTTRQDVEGVGSAFSFLGELAGEQAPILGTTLAGAGAGAALGSFVPVIGTGIGAVVGGAAASFPLLFGGNIQRQEEQVEAGELDAVNVERALIAAGGQAAIEGIAGRILAFTPFRAGVGNLWARTAKGAGVGVATEVPTEITQQLIERAQAGLPIDSDDAIQEYIDAGIAAGILGGGIGTVGGAVSPDAGKRQLEEDLTKLGNVARTKLAYGIDQIQKEAKEVDEIIAAPEPQVQLALPAPTATPEDQLVNRAADIVLSSMRVEGELRFPKARIALQKAGLSGETQKQTDSLIKQARDSLASQGVISVTPRGKKVDKYTVTPPSKMAENKLNAIRRDSNTAEKKASKLAKEIPVLELDFRYATQMGKDTKGNAVKPEEVKASLDSKKVQLNKLNERLESNQQELVALPDFYKVQAATRISAIPGRVTPEQLKEEIGPQLQAAEKRGETRTILDGLDKEQVEKKPEYTQREEAVMNNLRERLDKMGLKRVGLKGQKVIGSQDSLVEGQFDPMSEEKTITLALGVYDPSLSDADYNNSVSEVMNHEAVHALVDMNVFTPKEINLLKKAAKKTKFVNQEGKKRSYSYLDRAGRLNGELVGRKGDKGRLSAVEEEAIAEMYRDFVAGRLKNIGTSRPLFKRIGDFFRSIVGAHVDNGFNNVGSIFSGIGAGSVADRAPVTTVTQTPTSRTEVTKAKASSIPLPEDFVNKQDIIVNDDQIEATFGPIDLSKAGIKNSSIPLTPAQRDASILDYLNPQTGQPQFKKREGSETLVSFAEKLLGLRNVPPLDIINSESDKQDAARIMAAEAEAALISGSDALGWYDSTLKLAKRVLFPVYPEVSPERPDGSPNSEYDPAAEHAFDFATAITSNGLAVIDNYRFASEQYDAWKASDDGTFPVKGSGAQGGSMLSAFEFWNTLSRKGMSSNDIQALLTTQIPRKDLNTLMLNVLGANRVKDLPKEFQASGAEEADTMVAVAYILGPKIGNGFYQNLRGNYDPLTMDRWWMRFANRITGNPKVKYADELIEENLDKVWSFISETDQPLTDMDRNILFEAQRKLNISTIDKTDLPLIAPVIGKIWNKDHYNKAYKDTVEELLTSGQYEFSLNKSKTPVGRDAATVKELAAASRPLKTDFLRAAETYQKKLIPTLQEDPRSAQDRTAMREVANRARQILKDEANVDITNADFQALMWYAEKRLFEAGGVRKGRGDDNDYADGALNILKNKGIGDDKIKNSLPATERGRLAGVISQREGDGSGSGSVDAVKPTIAEGDFFAPRRLVLEAEPFITEADVDLSTMEGVESSNELPPQKLSQIPIDPYKAIRTPVKPTGTLTDIIYGGIQETDGEVIPVLLTEGNNDQFDNGGGLYHIQQRLHDKELIENSGYKRVEKAIYDTLHKWKSQGYQDGESVVAYPSGGNLVLEWFDNRMAKSPPLRLVLERGKRNSGKGPYYVKTFFPVMDKKDRKKIRNSQIKLSALNTVSGTGLDAMQADRVTRYTDIADWVGKALRLVPFTDKTKAQKRADLFIQKYQDSFIPVGRMIKELKEINPQYRIADSMDPYLKQQLSEGIAGSKITERKETIYKAATDAVKKMKITSQQANQLKALSNANSGGGKGLAEFTFEGTKSNALSAVDTYLYAKHAKERNAYIRTVDPTNDSGSGMTDAEADAILNWFDSLDPQNKIALRQAEDAVRSIVDDTNAVRVAAGLQTGDMNIGDMEDSNFDFYVPLKGHFEVDQEGIYGSGKPARYGAMGREDQRALGRRSYGRDILASTILQNTNSIVRGERNKVGQSMLDLVRSNPQGMSGYAEILDQPPSARVMQNGAVVIKPTRTYRDDPSIAIVKEDGKEKVLQFYDNNLAGAFNGENIWDAGNAATITRGLAKVNRYLSNINTSWNPEFFISNFIRDVQAAGIQVSEFEMDGLRKDARRNVLKAAKGLKRSILNNDDSSEWAKIYKDFRANGGASAANPMTTLQDQISDLQSALSDISDASGKLGLMKAKGRKLLEFMDNSNLVVENAIRVSTYDALVKRNVSKERAAQAARSVTVDFGKGGDNKAFLNSLYLFYNASLQGSFFLLRSLARSKKVRNIMGGVIAFGFTQDIINSMMSDEDEDGVKQYDKIPDYILEHNMVFMLPDVMDPFGRGYVSIPMPYGMNAFHNVGRNFAKMAQGRSDPSEIGASIGRTTLEIFNPLGGTESFLNFAAPTVFDPFISLYGTNTDFSGRDIVKKAFPNQVASQSSLYWNNTSPTAVGITQALNELTGGTETLSGWIDWSPNSLEFWFDYITGGAGRFVQRTAEAPARIAAAESAEDIATEIPFMRRVLRSVSSRDDASQYIEVRNQVNRATAEYKKAAQRGDVDRINSAISRFEAELRIAPQIRSIESARRKVSQQITAVNDSRLPRDEKDRIVKQLVEQRKLITRQGILIAQGI